VTDARDFFGYRSSEDEPGRREEIDDEELAPPQLDEAITLDDPAVLARIDPSDMLGRVLEIPGQLEQADRVGALGAPEVERVLVAAPHRAVDGGQQDEDRHPQGDDHTTVTEGPRSEGPHDSPPSYRPPARC
jgi:hypothetical protein